MIDAGCAARGDFALADTRVCLRPDRCPFARGLSAFPGCPETWTRALSALFPGDPGLALDVVGDLLEEIGDTA
jgi:hypothetical protein